MTDFVISNDLIVLGMSTFTGGLTFDGQMILDLDNTEALLVRKDGDGGDVFIVDTVNSLVQLPGSVALEIGSTPAAAGSIRLDATSSITMRNAADNGDLNLLSSPQSNEIDFGDAANPVINVLGTLMDTNRIRVLVTNAQAFIVANGSAASMLTVDTSGQILTVAGGAQTAPTASVDRLILDAVDVALNSTVGFSHSFLIVGKSQTSGAVDHDSNWRQFVSPLTTTGFDGQSLFRITAAIDGAAGTEIVRMSDEGRFAIAQPEQVSIGSPSFIDNVQVNITGSFIDDYGGGPTETHKLKIQGSQTGDTGRTTRQTSVDVDTSIITQNLSQTINEVGAMFIDAPALNIGTDTVNIAYALKVNNNPTDGTENYGLLVDSASAATNLTALTRIGKSFNQGIKLLVGGGVGFENIEGTAQMRLTNSYTPDGLQTEAMLLHVHTTLQATDGTTDHITGAFFEGSLRTQVEADENVANISQVRIDEPNIQDNLTGTGEITNAQSLLITGAPTEGESNYAQRILGGNLQIANASEFLFRNATDAADLTALSMGASNFLEIGGAGAAEFERVSIFSLGSIRLIPTDGVRVLTDNSSAFRVFNAAGSVLLFSVTQTGTVASGASGHAFGSPATNSVLTIDTTSTANGGGTNAAAVNFFPDYTGASGITEFIALMRLAGNITTQAVAEVITNVSTLAVDEPAISIGAGSSVTNAQTLFIEDSPTEGAANYAIRSLGAAPSLFAGVQFVIGRSTVLDYVQFHLDGSFTSGGGSNLVTGALFASDITSASGDIALSHIRAGVTGGGSIVTSGAGDSVLAATLWLDEPNITLTVSDSMAIAATLYISGAPTEGTSNNYSLFIDNGPARFDGAVQMFANSTFPNPANTFTFGSGVDQTFAQVAHIGAFTSSGLSNQAAQLYVAGALTGASGDTVSLAGLRMQNTITTQGATQVITDVAQAIFVEPVITIGTGDTVTNAQTVLIVSAPTEGTNNYALRVAAGDVLLGGNLAVSGAGPHSIAGTPSGIIGLIISETFTSDGSSTLASGVFVTQTLVGASGDTTSLTGVTFISAITTQTETESIANISQVEINEPFITDNLTGLITNAQSLLITGAPTEGVDNYAIRVASGAVILGGSLDVTGTTTTVGRIKTVTRQTTTYTILVTDSVVFGNTDSAGFTATLPAGVSGQTLRIINSGSSGNNLTVAPDGAEHLLGVNSSFTLFDGEALDLTFDTTDGWY